MLLFILHRFLHPVWNIFISVGGGGGETGEQDMWTEQPLREHRCANHMASEERALLSQADICLWAQV